MNLHEYQAKELLRDYGITTPRGVVIENTQHAEIATHELGGNTWVVKAQIHAGGRGKAGGVKLVKSVDELRQVANALLGKPLVTYQNAPHGQNVSRVLIEETLGIARELYLSLLVDRESERVTVVASVPAVWISKKWRASPQIKSCARPATRCSACRIFSAAT